MGGQAPQQTAFHTDSWLDVRIENNLRYHKSAVFAAMPVISVPGHHHRFGWYT